MGRIYLNNLSSGEGWHCVAFTSWHQKVYGLSWQCFMLSRCQIKWRYFKCRMAVRCTLRISADNKLCFLLHFDQMRLKGKLLNSSQNFIHVRLYVLWN